MTLEEKVAQMFIVRCPESNAVQVAQEYQFGGYILLSMGAIKQLHGLPDAVSGRGGSGQER